MLYLKSQMLSEKDSSDRDELLSYIRSKLKNRNFESKDAAWFDSGIGVETYGSYPCGLSTKTSDLDLRVND